MELRDSAVGISWQQLFDRRCIECLIHDTEATSTDLITDVVEIESIRYRSIDGHTWDHNKASHQNFNS